MLGSITIKIIVSLIVNGAGAVYDQKTSRFFVSGGKNPFQDTWV
jgi:hypothetical protein